MKVFLKCIFENNLGDDLFIRTVCNRYPDISFTAIARNNLTIRPQIPNLKVVHINNSIYKAFRKISFQLNRVCVADRILVSSADLVAAVGGSLFMENKIYKDSLKADKYYNTYWFEQVKKPLYIIGSNVGPVYNEHYLQKVKRIFLKADDVCLRDHASRDLAGIEKVRTAPDVIFGVIDEPMNTETEKKAVISVINCEKKARQMRNFNTEKYREAMIHLIRQLTDQSYNVILYSFCKDEGDEEEIAVLKERLGNTDHISEYFYKGDIDEALSVMEKAEIIVGTRFHANVIGFAMHKKVIPVIYNDKTRNLLDEIHFEGSSIDIEKDIYPDVSKLLSNEPLSPELIAQLKTDAQKQFSGLDQALKYIQ